MVRMLITIISVVLVFFAAVFGFTWSQANQEKLSLSSELQIRTSLLADSLKESIEPYYLVNSRDSIQKILDKFTNRERLLGLVIYDSKGIRIASSADLITEIVDEEKTVSSAMDRDKNSDSFLDIGKNSYYILVVPLHQNDRIAGAFMIVQSANYINNSVKDVWKANLVRLSAQALIFLLLIGLIIWIFIYRPLNKIIESIKLNRISKTGGEIGDIKSHYFFKPLTVEISKITKSLSEARSVASEEARLRLEKIDTPWTGERLKEFVKAYLKDQKIFIVFNGEPYTHNKGKNGIYWVSRVGGVLSALEPVMEACGGTWVAHGSGDADKETVDENDRIEVPPNDPKYVLKRVWLNNKEVNGYNKGYSAQGLYPLCFNTHTRPVFNEDDWMEYKRVNGKFAEVLLSEIKNIQRPIIIINEYHFTLLPAMIKASRPDARVGIFWHTPWPSAEAFSICPQRKEILEGMLGADVIGFHTQQFSNNFIDTIGKNVESLIDFEKFSITREEHTSYIRSFPIGVVFSGAESTNGALLNKEILSRLKIKTKYLGLGVDRLDYVKGIPERFKGIEYFLEKYPEYLEHFTFLQIASPCRTEIAKYLEYKEIVSKEAERINNKFGTKDWQPIVLEMTQYNHKDLDIFYKSANICVVTSLHDGMNLVSKEYVAARNDELGALVLSQFVGASSDLKEALIVNPYSTKEIGDAIHKGITMSRLEQHKRMKIMRSSVRNYNIYRWAAELIKAIAEL